VQSLLILDSLTTTRGRTWGAPLLLCVHRRFYPGGHPPRTDAERPLRTPTSSTRSAPTSTEPPARV